MLKTRGFTLMELLVVLVILGLTAGVALPNMVKLYDNFQKNLDWQTVVSEINGLRLIAFRESESFYLHHLSNHPERYNIALPDNWDYAVENPIFYKSNGACLGGKVRFFFQGELFKVVELFPPRCELEES